MDQPRAGKKAPHRSTEYRRKLKEENPEIYKAYLRKQQVRVKEKRKLVAKELNKHNPDERMLAKKKLQLVSHKESQRRYMERVRESGRQKTQKENVKRLTRIQLEKKREYNREKKREERAKMSKQKKMRVQKKDRESKAKMRRTKENTSTENFNEGATNNVYIFCCALLIKK